MDGRRHSVDIPISKTLVALRRVRSLRDPSTNSMSKLSALVDNLNWETNSNNGITLGFVNGTKDGSFDHKDLGLFEQRVEHVSDCEMYYGSRKHNSKLVENSGWAGFIPVGTQVEGSNLCRSNKEPVFENESLGEKYCNDYLEGVGSCNDPIERSPPVERVDHTISKQKSRYRKKTRPFKAAGGDVMSRIGSPCLSTSDGLVEGSTRSPSLYGNEDVDVVGSNHSGCGISRCWSRTPRFRESNYPSDVEDQPLLSGEGDISHRRAWKLGKNEITPYSGSPRSLSQKFRPKSFSELVGQNVVSRSLLSAISSGRITPFYLFHGARGTGKTSASRIFAAALNCFSLDENRPCGLCQECVLFFSGRSRDVKEVDSVKINRAERVRYLIKNAMIPPVSSRFKVFIVDDCHLLRGATWAFLLNNLEELSRHVVFVMITPDLDKLPRGAVSRSQRYHFPKIKEVDIVYRLSTICSEEGFDYDSDALDFIATKSNGSLRDAEMLLEQLSLLGKRITISLAYELIGMVSDDELLDLLDLALSSDTPNTVRRARGLMRSRIDPMHLISQLANLIMDILAGKSQDGVSEVKKKFFERHSSEADLQQLGLALKVLSETEKQLRTSKNQTTWLTVALLQLSSGGSSSSDLNDSRLCLRTLHPKDGDFCSTSSTGESLKHLVSCGCDNNSLCKLGMQDERGSMESIWSRATELCESSSLRNFLHKRGNLASVSFNKGVAVVELEFPHHDHVRKAEKSWKLIANALQSTLGCNVEIRINLVQCASLTKYAKVKKASLRMFSCSRRILHGSQSTTELGSDPSGEYNSTSDKQKMKDKSLKTFSSDCGSQVSHICCHRKRAATTIRNSDGNTLGTGVIKLKEEERSMGSSSSQEPEKQPSCFIHRRLHSSDSSNKTFLSIESQNKLALSIPAKTATETCFCAADPYMVGSTCKNYSNCTGVENRRREDLKVCCWRSPKFPFKKAWQLKHQRQGTLLVERVITCGTAK